MLELDLIQTRPLVNRYFYTLCSSASATVSSVFIIEACIMQSWSDLYTAANGGVPLWTEQQDYLDGLHDVLPDDGELKEHRHFDIP